MDINQLEVLVTVSRERSFSRAAELLERTQPAVSQAIRRLEAEIGELVRDVENPELPRELEAIDDPRLGLEADVLGPQVAVAFDINALVGPALKQRPHASQSIGHVPKDAVGLGMVAACWWWAGRVMHLPEAERVFDR